MVMLLLALHLFSQDIPQLINYQGELTDAAGNVVNGNFTIQFKIYNSSSGGTALWTESQSLTITDGRFQVLLGSINPIPYDIFHENSTYLALKVGNDNEMTPRKRMVSVGYAFTTRNADKLDDKDADDLVQKGEVNSVSTGMIQNDAVTASKIAPPILSSLDGVTNDGGNIDLIAGSNITITPSDGANTITISSAGGGGGGDITAVYAGTGLDGGGTSNDVTLSVEVPFRLSSSSDEVVKGNHSSTGNFGYLGSQDYGVYGQSMLAFGVKGYSRDRDGVRGESQANAGVYGLSLAGPGVYGSSTTGTGVYGKSVTGLAGKFDGNVQINGNLNVVGVLSKIAGVFRIDHPLDPVNKYLQHSFVESPDMKNVYDGVVVLDAKGEMTVELPEWFGALNQDFRYQLTCIGGFAPVYIADEIFGNRFKISGGRSGMKVSWQVTGIRHDAWAEKNRIPVEVEKQDDEHGG